MNIQKAERDGHLVLAPDAESIDVTNAVSFKQELVAVASDADGNLILDLAAVTFMDSSGLGAIVSCLKALGRKGDLVLTNVQPGVQALLDLTRMARVMNIYPTVDAAVASLG